MTPKVPVNENYVHKRANSQTKSTRWALVFCVLLVVHSLTDFNIPAANFLKKEVNIRLYV